MNDKINEGDASRPKRSILMMFVLGFMAFAVYKWVLVDRMGFCYKRLWFTSSEELVLKTVDGLMKSGKMKLDAQDTSPQAYLAHHPDCCRINWGGGTFDRGLIYFASASVMVSYEMKREDMGDADKKKYQTLYYDFYSDRTACGEPVGYTGSIEDKPIEQRSQELSILLERGYTVMSIPKQTEYKPASNK